MKCLIFGGYSKKEFAVSSKDMRKTILDTKEYANVYEPNYFNMSKHLTRILEV